VTSPPSQQGSATSAKRPEKEAAASPTAQEPYAREVRRKAERMARARRQHGMGWEQLAHVGSLGFLFVLPVLLGAFGGRWLERAHEVPKAGLVGVAMGLLLGGYLGGRQLYRALHEPSREAEE